MTTDQVLAKVRAAAAKFIDDGYSAEDEVVARAALAMVEQLLWHRDEARLARQDGPAYSPHWRAVERMHEAAIGRLRSALRTAVGE